MKDWGSRERMERSAPASRMDRAVMRVCGGVWEEGIRALCWRRASFAFWSWDCVREASLLLSDCWRVWRMESREGAGCESVAEGMVTEIWDGGELRSRVCFEGSKPVWSMSGCRSRDSRRLMQTSWCNEEPPGF